MGDDLYRFAQVVTAPLFFEHAFVDLTGGEVVGFLHARFDETLIVTQIKIGFGAIVGDEHLAMLEWRHGAGVHIQIRVEFDQGDFEAARFENRSQGSGGNPLAKGRHYTAGDEDKFGHVRVSYELWKLVKRDYRGRPRAIFMVCYIATHERFSWKTHCFGSLGWHCLL